MEESQMTEEQYNDLLNRDIHLGKLMSEFESSDYWAELKLAIEQVRPTGSPYDHDSIIDLKEEKGYVSGLNFIANFIRSSKERGELAIQAIKEKKEGDSNEG